MKQSISCDPSLEESVQRHQALGNRMGRPREKDKAEISRTCVEAVDREGPPQPGQQALGDFQRPPSSRVTVIY